MSAGLGREGLGALAHRGGNCVLASAHLTW